MADESDVILQSADGEKLTALGAAKDLGFFFWLFSAVVGAPSIISLFQTVFIDFRLFDLLQWILDGYQDILSVLGDLIEPASQYFFSLLSPVLGFDLQLQPHWRPLFIVLSIFISANARSLWIDGYKVTTFLFAAIMLISAVAGSWFAGIVPSNADWMMQGAAAAVPVLMLFSGMWLSYALATLFFGFAEGYRKPLSSYILRGFALSFSAFVIASLLSLIMSSDQFSGVLVLFSGMFFYGAFWVFEGFRTHDVPEVRFGLRVLGGYIFAIFILSVNVIVQAFGGS